MRIWASTRMPPLSPISRPAALAKVVSGRTPAFLAMFNVPQLERVAQEVEESIIKIMNETAKG